MLPQGNASTRSGGKLGGVLVITHQDTSPKPEPDVIRYKRVPTDRVTFWVWVMIWTATTLLTAIVVLTIWLIAINSIRQSQDHIIQNLKDQLEVEKSSNAAWNEKFQSHVSKGVAQAIAELRYDLPPCSLP